MTYDPTKYFIIFGTMEIGGLGVDAIRVEQAGDGFVKEAAGLDGNVQRTLDPRTDFSVEVDIQKTSPYNDALSGYHLADKISGAGYEPITVKDVNGTTLHFAEQAWIVKFPNDDRTKEAGMYTWRIETGRGAQFIGGSAI